MAYGEGGSAISKSLKQIVIGEFTTSPLVNSLSSSKERIKFQLFNKCRDPNLFIYCESTNLIKVRALHQESKKGINQPEVIHFLSGYSSFNRQNKCYI